MKINVIASTNMGYNATKADFDNFSGKCAGVCYMAETFEELLNEDPAKTAKRVEQTKVNGHHSVFDHETISLYLDGVPKIIAMILNNEKQYATSEKSARYTRMQPSEQEQILYNKWLEILKNRIAKKYQEEYPAFFTDAKITKLAQENARYLISVFTPTSMVYTTTFRQFNYIIAMCDAFINKVQKSKFESAVMPYVSEFVSLLKEMEYYDPKLSVNEKNRTLSLFAEDRPVEEYFGDVYACSYTASFAELAQAQRHRTISYNMSVLENEYYVPPIIAESEDLKNLWIDDLKSLGGYPTATLLNVNEFGNLDGFILKMKERKCTMAQLEINQITNDILKKYAYALRLKVHPRAEEILNYTHGSRCTFPDYKCPAPCGFALGINETRQI